MRQTIFSFGGVKNHRCSLRQRAMLALLLIAAMLVPQLLSAQTATQPAVGDGSASNPYQITTAEELAWFRDKVNSTQNNACAKLVNDIDMKKEGVCHPGHPEFNGDMSWTPISNKWTGTFDGNNKTISNLYIRDYMSYAGLFGDIGVHGGNGAVIKNLILDNADVGNWYPSTLWGYTGILVGRANNATITNVKICKNSYVGASGAVGGLVGQLTGEISDCANYASVESTSAEYAAGGIAGSIWSWGKLKNVFNCGDVTAASMGGMIVGANTTVGDNTKSYSLSAEGLVAFNSDATLTINESKVTPVAIGKGTFSSGVAVGYSKSMLKTGCATYLLQQNAATGVDWGQDLADAENAYPVLGSTSRVYIETDFIVTCKGEITSGSFTNTKPENEGVYKFTHTSATHTFHEGVAATCLTDGKKAYYECDYCHRIYADEAMTDELSGTTIKFLGHDYYGESDKCSRCGTEIPVVKLGDNTIFIDKVAGNDTKIYGWNFLKFVAPESGNLQVELVYDGWSYTKGSLWTGKKTWLISDGGAGNNANFKFSNKVTKGETYYIGAASYRGDAIGNRTLNIKLNGLEYIPCEGVEGDGTAETPFELKTAEHLKWFGEYVNGATSVPSRPAACAKLMNDISLSSVCHAAGSGYDTEVSWEPISPESVKWSGTFDGNGKTISDLYINTRDRYVGLFGSIGAGTIKNINFENATVTTKYSYSGILVGKASGATVLNIKTDEKSSVAAEQNWAGGIAGQISGSIQNCKNYANVTAEWARSGGICGDLAESPNSETSSISEIKGCANYGIVKGYWGQVGGIVGSVANGLIEDCANYAAVEVKSDVGYVGGVIGWMWGGTIKNVFSNADVTDLKSGEIGLVVGKAATNDDAPKAISATGLIAFSSDATLTANGKKVEARAIGSGGVDTGADCVIAFTAAQIKSGEVTYKLNGGVVDGTQTWYQKLGDGGDACPVMTAAEGNTVYKAVGYTCDEQLIPESTPVYANTKIYHTPHHFDLERGELTGVYAIVCSSCGTYKDDKRTIKDFAGMGNDLEVIESPVGSCKYRVDELTLKDGDPYYSPVTFSVGSLSYDRSFAGKAGKWQALYVPFALDCSEISDSYEVAAINNFHEYEQKDGTTKVVLEVKKLTSGTIDVLTPCVIRLKEDGDATQPVLKNGSIESELVQSRGDNANRYIDCSSVTRYYRFTGLLQPKQGFSADNDFALLDGKLTKANADATLKAQRWYLTATDRTAAASAMTLRSIAIDVIGEGEATGIADLYVTTDSDNTPSSLHGIYDLQGRKLDREPASGVYIKDGRKYVK